jgi:microcystin-dependent protein
MEAFVGTICLFPYERDWAPEKWFKCDGQLLQISQHQHLYSLIGNKYGGDGMTTFALPKIAPLKDAGNRMLYYCIAYEGIYPPRP